MKTSQSGFTLLEMLAALTVMAVCSGVLLVAFGQSARSLQQVSRSDRLSHAARTIMDQESAGPLENGTRQGTLAGIDWTLDIRQLSGANGQTRMFRLDLMVSEHQRKAQFSTLKLRGAVSGAAGGAGS
ncbi:type II secretion system protein [Pseudomonas syringae pv. actinidiae]|uniref:Proteinral secretion pathway protein GspI n=13 Tax=Pseudomonas syringae group TaxID=136849 RepID=A0A3M5U3T4_9PSED|nr:MULTISPECIES: type II secretion system protein [Pseudomonas syringae group]EPN13666.1 general secretion pathway protein I [Pseudomonas syringae pv. actinidiae ICMP 19070]EPN62052.1 general secretion pathway protein I [Pseudomonas syringae pv. actinidiae ICMP 19079]EPN74862.1 general secretion pathway protein I [Pseudomonas syringae pv. actinidiae ICMP 19101]AKT30195.1 general secretion pathway protein GspI [Pseudomonas syringae pv. actinidiae ICMP 18884]AOE56638.1 general secretion pathway 